MQDDRVLEPLLIWLQQELKMAKFEILLLGDGSHLFRTIAWVLEYKGYAVKAAATPEAALEAMVKKNYDLVITKLSVKELDGLDVLKRARKMNPGVKVMVVSATPDMILPVEAYQLEIDDYLLMPISPAELWRRVNACLEGLEVVELRASRPAAPKAKNLNEQVLNHLLIMMHDIRGSLVSTDATLQLVLRGRHGAIGSETEGKLQEVSGRLQNLVQLTQDFVGKALTEEPAPQIEHELLDLGQDVVKPVLSELTVEIREKGITLDNRLEVEAKRSLAVRGSKVWLQSIFRNLLTNGIKHGGSGCTIVVSWEKDGPNGRLNVYNTGGPIPEERRSMLFANRRVKTRQGKDERSGLGVGLYLSRNLAQSQGGDIKYEAKAGGSNFVFSLPHG
jgi:signal transduction histidine kinase